ncbi:vesicle-associated protein 4-1-like isoform X2 [Juglans microcarpa x Juglans regia]|uniref:vesicle-associated protein 4-1-like isoform X2 n=1 Tax=Juglans microcarpa x Juglans regia TaxID=2249226 RepID=UPI001B7ED542|nr:vesicle-associated protein 4-1-like isoform X2 [Juglans microcarpa x Juglans regia]
MALADHHHHRTHSDLKLFRLCPFWQSGNTSSSSSSTQNLTHSNRGQGNHSNRQAEGPISKSSSKTVSSVARSLLPPRRRLRLDPANNLYFPNEPGKQVKSAIRLKNTSRSHVAFKFQTTAPKSCYMRPPGGILAPGESIIATVFKFVEHIENNEKPADQKSKIKFKIMSLKVKGGVEYVPELALDKLKRQLAEAEAALEARKKPPIDTGPRVVGEGLVIDEWKERREKYLARQQVEAVESA